MPWPKAAASGTSAGHWSNWLNDGSKQSDPGRTRQELTETADLEMAAVRAIVEEWEKVDPDGTGKTAAEILQRLELAYSEHDAIRNAVVEIAPPKSGKDLPSARSLGKAFRKIRRRVVGGKFLDARDRKHTLVWFRRWV